MVQNLKKNQQYIWSFRLFLIIIIRIWYSSIGQCQPYWFVGWCFSTFQVYLNIFYNLVGLITIFSTKYDFHKYWIVSGYHENYGIATRALLEEIVRKGIGIFILALLNSFLISAVIHYLQVCRIIFKHSQKLKNTKWSIIIYDVIWISFLEVSLDLVVWARWWKHDFGSSLHQRSHSLGP